MIKRVSKARVLKKSQNFAISAFRFILIICLMYMILYPLLRMIAEAFVHPHVLGSVGSLWIPAMVTTDNFIVAWHVMNYLPSLGFTTMVITIIMLLQILNASLAGYAFARLRFRGINILFGLVLVGIVVPNQVLFLPQSIMFRHYDFFGILAAIEGTGFAEFLRFNLFGWYPFGWLINGPWNLLGEARTMYVMAGLGQGLAGGIFIYIFRQFFRGLPKELEEAAYVDGAGVLRTFFTIAMPMSKPAILTVGTLSFIWNWNDSFFQSVFDPRHLYMRMRISHLNSPGGGGTTIMQQAINQVQARLPDDIVTLTTPIYDASIINVANLLSILPLIILFLLIQRQFVEGVERSGIVG